MAGDPSGDGPFFFRNGGVLQAEDVPLPEIAEDVGTPVYVYSAAALRHAAGAFRQALSSVSGARFAFAVKANPNPAVLRILADCGYGADIVSGGEMRRALAAGIGADAIVFSGVGKSDRELAGRYRTVQPRAGRGGRGPVGPRTRA